MVSGHYVDMSITPQVNEDYMKTLEILSKKLKFVEVDSMVKTSKALNDVQPELEKLRQKAVSKVCSSSSSREKLRYTYLSRAIFFSFGFFSLSFLAFLTWSSRFYRCLTLVNNCFYFLTLHIFAFELMFLPLTCTGT